MEPEQQRTTQDRHQALEQSQTDEHQREQARLRARLIEQGREQLRLRSMLRLDRGTLGQTLRAPVYWAVLVAAMMPLLLLAAGLPTESGLIICFASLWFVLFQRLLALDRNGSLVWDYLLVASLTVMPGMVIIHPGLSLLLARLIEGTETPSLAAQLPGYLLGVGPAEELSKMIPVLLALALANRIGRRPCLQASILLGITAGLVFAAFENLRYTSWFATELWGLPYNRQDLVLSRLLMTPFLHSVWSGLTGFAAGVVINDGHWRWRRLLHLGLPALALAALLHGLYDVLASLPLPAVAVAALSYLLLLLAVAAAKRWQRQPLLFLHDPIITGASDA